MIEKLKEFGTVYENISLKNYNTYKIDGKAKYLIFPNSEEDLINLLKYLKENNTSYTILGNGSNVIIPDNYYDGVIIKLDKFNDIFI